MKNYIDIVKHIIDNYNFTTYRREFKGSDYHSDSRVYAGPTTYFWKLFTYDFYKIQGTNETFHDKEMVNFLKNYEPCIEIRVEDAIKNEKKTILQMDLHPCPDSDRPFEDIRKYFFDKLFKDKKILNEMQNGDLILFLYQGWESAELIKHTANAFLAMKLTFINEIATLCEMTGANIKDVTNGIGYDPRIGIHYMQAGPGWGGSCFPKDSASLTQVARSFGFDFTLLEHTIELNQKHLDRTANKVKKMIPKDIEDKRVSAWGLTFKAGTDDLRYSPAVEVLKRLETEQFLITAFDPTVKGKLPELPLTEIANDPYACAEGSDLLAILTEWDDFKQLDMETVALSMRNPNLLDTRNVFEKHEMERIGFTYIGMGT